VKPKIVTIFALAFFSLFLRERKTVPRHGEAGARAALSIKQHLSIRMLEAVLSIEIRSQLEVPIRKHVKASSTICYPAFPSLIFGKMRKNSLQ
jgi:hypothetical protein